MKYKIYFDGKMQDGCLIDEYSYHRFDRMFWNDGFYNIQDVYSTPVGFMVIVLSRKVQQPFSKGDLRILDKEYEDAKSMLNTIDEH